VLALCARSYVHRMSFPGAHGPFRSLHPGLQQSCYPGLFILNPFRVWHLCFSHTWIPHTINLKIILNHLCHIPPSHAILEARRCVHRLGFCTRGYSSLIVRDWKKHLAFTLHDDLRTPTHDSRSRLTPEDSPLMATPHASQVTTHD
jgi:hypothetical protein